MDSPRPLDTLTVETAKACTIDESKDNLFGVATSNDILPFATIFVTSLPPSKSGH
jgi:hypothetical protein